MTVTQRWLQRLTPIAAAPELDWEQVYAEELPRIYNFFRYRVGDGMLAEDLTAATFEKAWRARQRYHRNRAAFSTWLFTIARNVGSDYFRRRQPLVSWETLHSVAGGETPEQTVERRTDFARVSELLGRLPARERELVALKYGAGLTNREIARLTKLSESNAGTILHRVTTQLRAQWDAREA